MKVYQFALCVLLLGSTRGLAAEPAVSPARKVLFIGIDGTRTDALAAAGTPHLDALAAGGLLSTDCAILGPRNAHNDTISGPGWSSIYTGVWADKHGVTDNNFKHDNYARYPHFFALLRQSRPDAVTGSFSTWAPIHDRIVTAATISRGFSDKDSSYEQHDTQAAAAAVAFLGAHNPQALCVYFGQVDEAGHSHGFHPSVPQYIQAIEDVDSLVGRVLDAVRARPTYAAEQWLVIVTTDHGGRGTGHGGGHAFAEVNTVWLIVSGAGVQPAAGPTAIVDVVPTALAWLGVPVDPHWELDGQAVGIEAVTP